LKVIKAIKKKKDRMRIKTYSRGGVGLGRRSLGGNGL
jgi:hypothetical protein